MKKATLLIILLISINSNNINSRDITKPLQAFSRVKPAQNLRRNTTNRSNLQKPLVAKGCIKASNDWNNVPQVRLFFNGQETISDKDGFYSFTLDKNINKFYVLIYKYIKHDFSGINTIENLRSFNNKKPLFFSFEKIVTKNNVQWIKSEENYSQNNFLVPENCLIATINPKYIESVEKWNIKLPENFTQLPKIVLKENFNEKRASREAAKSLLYSLDSVTFHEPIKTYKKIEKGQKITLAK